MMYRVLVLKDASGMMETALEPAPSASCNSYVSFRFYIKFGICLKDDLAALHCTANPSG